MIQLAIGGPVGAVDRQGSARGCSPAGLEPVGRMTREAGDGIDRIDERIDVPASPTRCSASALTLNEMLDRAEDGRRGANAASVADALTPACGRRWR